MTTQTPVAVAAAANQAAVAGPKRTLTPLHTMALQAIRDEAVVCHPAWSHHTPGWGWAGGGDVTLTFQGALSELHALRLLRVDTTVRDHVDGDPVTLTGAGDIVLDRLAGA